MTTTEIKQQLCYYDKRNPDNLGVERILSKDTWCGCDNCFRGKDKLANELLRVKEQNILMLKTIEDTRLWYVNEGYKALAPETPLVFSKLLDFILPMNKDKGKFI